MSLIGKQSPPIETSPEVSVREKRSLNFSRAQIYPFLLFFALLLVLYFRIFSFPFIFLDDQWLIYDNPYLQELSWENLTTIINPFAPRHDLGGEYLPLRDLSYFFDRLIWDFAPGGYHLSSFLVHALTCLLLFFFMKKLFSHSQLAFWTSAIFAFHPLQVEAVCWASARKDLLYVFFLLCSFLCYLSKEKKSYGGALLCFLAATLCKAPAVIGAFILGLFHIYFPEKVQHRSLKSYFLFPLLAVFLAIMHMSVYADPAPTEKFHWAYVLFSVSFSLSYYLKLFSFPVNLALEYPLPADFISSWDISAYLSILLCLLISIAIAYSFLLARKNKMFFGIPFFAISLIPTLYIVSFRSISPIADRYMYLAIIGLSMSMGYLLFQISTISKKHKCYSFLILAFFFLLSWQRISYWQEHEKLADDNVLRYPEVKSSLMRRSFQLAEKGQFNEAWEVFQRLGNDHKYWLQKARLLKKIKQYTLAENTLQFWLPSAQKKWRKTRAIALQLEMHTLKGEEEKALQILHKWFWEQSQRSKIQEKALVQVGDMKQRHGKHQEALLYYERALLLFPKEAYIYSKIGDIHLQLKKMPTAEKWYDQALSLAPDYLPAKINLGWCFFYQKKYQEALSIAKNILEKEDNPYAKLLREKSLQELGNSKK